MTPQDRIKDIQSVKTESFNSDEIKQDDDQQNFFSAIEYYLIIHLTNEELYYTDDETLGNYDHADLKEDTDKGRVFGFK